MLGVGVDMTHAEDFYRGGAAVRRRRLVLGGVAALAPMRSAMAGTGFDHQHIAWTALLRRHVQVAPSGFASGVRYAALGAERSRLQAYLVSLSVVPEQDYRRWTGAQQLAFLVNAYNAFTVDLVLSQYPGLGSIRDLGSILQSPWKKKFFRLLGQERSLDDIEHGMIRVPGAFDDHRIHCAVVCASVGCPMLRDEAFTAQALEAQLDDALLRFLSDRKRNRHVPTQGSSGILQVSKIFDWYRRDFEQGYRGISSLPALFARHAAVLADDPAAQREIREGRSRIEFLDYDWRLNDAS